MKILLFVMSLNLILFGFQTTAQVNFNGVWKGALYEETINDSASKAIFVSITKFKNITDAFVRIEKPGTIDYATFKFQGVFENSILQYTKFQIDKQKNSPIKLDKSTLELNYIDSSGYLQGYLTNLGKNKKIVLFKTDGIVDSKEKKETSHAWLKLFQREFSLGMVAPIKREEERKNFQFESVYFDPTKSDLKPEYTTYLKKIINVINGHTDLRLKVIGHTDWNGSDQYNEELSKKRAETIIQFLERNGLSRDRIEYEYQGEKSPIESNETHEGRKLNRRVDFEFI